MATPVEIASQYFLSPFGLLALLGIVPLIIFYLVRPRPEERVMPSMTFFMKDKRSGKVSQALDFILRNLLLLFHILLVAGFAATIAQPYITGNERPENAVIVLDRSASMENDLDAARDFIESNLAKENTLVVVDQDVSVPLEKASPGQVRSYIDGFETVDLETDIASALELLQDYEGNAVIASDLDQTADSRSVKEMIQRIRRERDTTVMETDNSNSWGIVQVDPGKRNSTVDVKNFMEQDAQIGIRVNDGARQVKVEAGEVKTVTVATEAGRNTVELEADEVESDNKAYISVPEERNFDVVFIADRSNPYFEKAVELIEFTDIRSVSPPLDETPEADIYVIGETDRLLKSTVNDIEGKVRDGRGMVVFAQERLSDKGFESVPGLKQERNATVEILEPVKAKVGATRVFGVEKNSWKSLSEPREAVIRSSHGRGNVMLYNVEDEDFRFDFLYPVFWKHVFADMVDQPDVEELNIRTGDIINQSRVTSPSGKEMKGGGTAREAGFYNTSKFLYAANLASADESGAETPEIERTKPDTQQTRKDIQKFAAGGLLLLVLLEMFYLARIGEL